MIKTGGVHELRFIWLNEAEEDVMRRQTGDRREVEECQVEEVGFQLAILIWKLPERENRVFRRGVAVKDEAKSGCFTTKTHECLKRKKQLFLFFHKNILS